MEPRSWKAKTTACLITEGHVDLDAETTLQLTPSRMRGCAHMQTNTADRLPVDK